MQITKLVRSKLALVLHFENEEEIEIDSRFSDLGLDSLVSVEFKNIKNQLFLTKMFYYFNMSV